MLQKTTITGLTDVQVRLSREKHGANKTDLVQRNGLWQTIKDIVTEPLFVILVGASLVYFILGSYSEGAVMLVALMIVSGIGIYQENKSRSAVDELRKLSAPSAKVIRNGRVTQVAFEDIVLGDIIIAEEGISVPADAVIIEQHDFTINESVLTGEALPVTKDADGVDNLIYQGTLVASGSCVAEVRAIGNNTEFGKISKSIEAIEEPKTPLQIQISQFVRSMASVGVVVFIIVWAVNYYLSSSILHGLLHGLTIAMSVLPEEIPVAFSTFMALGAYRLYKNKVIVRNPHTVETLGAATVICTDKTGTITENKMELSCIYDFGADKEYDYTRDAFNFTPVLELAMWASEMDPFDMMEKALHSVYGKMATIDERVNFQMVHEYPLGGKPPIMTHVFSDKKGRDIVACKGSVEGVLRQCNVTATEQTKILKIASDMAARGFRVLAVGESDHNIKELPSHQTDLCFTFIGLVGFYDPPKKNITQVLSQFYDAGIGVKMITGDHAATASSIAAQVHMQGSKLVLTGDEVMAMSAKELQESVREVNVFARMFPEAKLKVIEALRAGGEVVAMTGDGVNDGPALKAAHIGIAMGLRGSEIAKKVASLILVDDDLSHMVEAVALGRRIYENLKKAIQYIISIHIPIILIVLIPLMLSWKFSDVFSPIHVIFLELIMGPTCSIIFENEPIEANSMLKRPRKMSNTFFSFRELSLSIVQGLVITGVCLGLGYYYMNHNASAAGMRTVIYTTLIFSNLFLTLVNRSFYYSVFTTIRYKNRLVPGILIVSLVVLGLSLSVPAVVHIFEFEPIQLPELVISFLAAAAGVMWVEVYKYIIRSRRVSLVGSGN